MRYPAAETAEKHKRALEEASRLFRERGFSGASIAEIMAATGLTHGSFYNHFASKEALMAECIDEASQKALSDLSGFPESASGRRDYLKYYLSVHHRDHPGQGCLIAALATGVTGEPMARKSLTTHIKSIIGGMSSRFPWSSKRAARRETMRTLASMVGAMIIARAVEDPFLSEEILNDVLSGL